MDEKALVQLSKKGDEEAFSVLVKKYRAKIFNLAFSLTYDREIADDLAQEAFIKAYFALPKFKLKSEFGTWLYRITVNHVKDYLRKKGRMDRMSLVDIKENPFLYKDEIMKKEKDQVEEEKRRLIHECVQTLPKKYQIILSLRDIQGFSYREIAKILKIFPGTVDSRLHRARKMLRKKLTPLLRKKGGNHEL